MLHVGISATAGRMSLTARSGEGAATFVTHLIDALLALPEPLRLTVTRRAGDDAVTPRHARLDVLAIEPGADGRFSAPPADVWVLPSMHCHRPAAPPAATVVLIHDLVSEQLPELFEPAFREDVRQKALALAEEATLVACMSRTTRDLDLLGALGLPSERVRTVATAWPLDLPALTDDDALALAPARPTRPYLLFPAKYRPNKNHAVLLDALWRLRDYYRADEFDVVFTGDSPAMEPALAERARRLHVADRVHRTGTVSRAQVAALYRRAFLTVVPSLHEQGSYPIAEALACGCPVACSDIPPFREQCAPLGDAMRYFDPRDPHSVARCVLDIHSAREDVRRAQAAAAPALLSRGWDQVAREWLAVFREAAATSANTAAY